MNLESMRSNEVRMAVAALLLLAVVGGAYLVFAEQDTVEISNAEELQQIREDLDGHYVLVDDIDMSGIDNFDPIGYTETPEGAITASDVVRRPFSGEFDGNGHTISSLMINRPDEIGVGLFHAVGSEGSIRNVTLKDVNVTGGSGTGGLAGMHWGTVTETRVTGKVSGGRWYVGGIVGYNDNPSSQPGGKIRESYAKVDTKGNSNVGGVTGLIGRGSVVSKSYAVGNVSGRKNVGGLVGKNLLGKTIESYAAGRVDGDEDVGGLIGMNSGDVMNSYWDINSTGQSESAGGTGLTTSEMTGSAARENMEGFDFEETWRTTEDDYPRLAWQTEEDE